MGELYIFPTSYTPSSELDFRDYNNIHHTRTIQTVINSVRNSLGAYKAFFIVPGTYYGAISYHLVAPFNFSNDEIKCVDKDNTDSTYIQNNLFAGVNLISGSALDCYNYGTGDNNLYFSSSQNLQSTTVNNITYKGYAGLQLPTILVLPDYNGTVYLNDTNVTPPVFTWAPFERLTGNNGQFQMDLTTIDASIIGDGETITFVSDDTKVNVIQRTNLYNLAVNMLDGQEYTIAYCGDNYLTMKRRTDVIAAGTDIYITLKFYFRSDTLIFTSDEYRLRMVGDFPHVTYWLSMIYDEENEVAAPLLLGGTWYVASDSWNYTFGGEPLPSETQLSALYIWLQDNGNAQSNNPYGTGTTDNGGDPEGNRQQDHITAAPLPTCSGFDLGLVTLYRPDAGQLANIAAFLWSDNVLDNFKKYFNNFADNILSLYSLPFTPSGLPTKTFTVGKMTSEVTGVEYCTVRFFDIDMGQVEIKNKWGSYLDYSPYTKIEIYLPYLGNHTLDTDELMSPARMDGSMPDKQGTVLSLVYRLDILTGVIVAMIKVRVYTKTGGYTDEIRYQFSGKVGSTTPLTGATYANMVNAILSAGAGLATTIATGGLTAPLTAAAAVTGTVQASKPNVERIGAISGDASMLATNVPYVCISVPNKPYLDQQEIYTGFPSYKAGTLGSFEGFTQVIEAHVEGISCTEEERTLILKWLKEGVII